MTAFVEPSTGKIIGAEKYSLAWFHEKGHIEYQESEKGMKNSLTAQTLLKLTIFFTVLGLFSFIFAIAALVTVSGWVYYGIHEEIWCWKYAKQMKRRYLGK